MKVSRAWLQTYFSAPLPDAAKLAEAITFRSSEVEEVIQIIGGDAVLDVKVLPDKSAWMLSHRGVAKELSVILDAPLSHDPLAAAPELAPTTDAIRIDLATEKCARYAAALVRGVTVGPSPAWLRAQLEAIGQRSINNVVDATNYVLFGLGQPIHAFDAKHLATGDGYTVGVRAARTEETITALDGAVYELSGDDLVIVNGADEPLGIAGVKGGMHSGISGDTTDLFIESANFDRVSVRLTSKRLRLRTDASARYENGVVPELAGYGLAEVVRLILEVAGGELAGYADVFPSSRIMAPVSVSLAKANSVLGLSLSMEDLGEVFRRFGYEHTLTDEVVTIVPPFERDDLVIPEDLIEEIGRIYGLAHIAAVTPEPLALGEVNARFFYAEEVRDALLRLGFSEVYTSSFNERDEVCLENALASDKGCLRSSLRPHIEDALTKNVLQKDLLGLDCVALFEVGTVFTASGGQRSEHLALSFGVRTGPAYKPKSDDPLMEEAKAVLTKILGTEDFHMEDGVAEINLDEAFADLPPPVAYRPYVKDADATYRPFSPYPHVSRDVALWAGEGTLPEEVENTIREAAGPLLVRLRLFDEFQKDGRTSYAFRLVFQSYEKTLTDGEAGEVMERVYGAVKERGWEVR